MSTTDQNGYVTLHELKEYNRSASSMIKELHKLMNDGKKVTNVKYELLSSIDVGSTIQVSTGVIAQRLPLEKGLYFRTMFAPSSRVERHMHDFLEIIHVASGLLIDLETGQEIIDKYIIYPGQVHTLKAIRKSLVFTEIYEPNVSNSNIDSSAPD